MSHIASTLEIRRFLLPALLVTIAVAAIGYARTDARVSPPPVIECTELAHPLPPPLPVDTVRQLPSYLPIECRDYLAALDRITRCQTLPIESRDAIDNAIATTLQAWRDLPPEVMPQLIEACRSAQDAVNQAGESLCPSAQQRATDRRLYR